MKKVLLGSAAVVLGLAVAAPAFAQGVELDLGGHYKGYAVYQDFDEGDSDATDERSLDWLQETEIHFSGEATLDNGLTVGAHVEAEVDEGDNFATDEAYAYFSGAWGRVNAGNEDGAAYLLQVAAPSADSNIDGIRQFVNPNNTAASFNGSAASPYYGSATINGITLPTAISVDGLDYDNDLTTEADKLTYLTPVFEGFQGGLSYTPDVQDFGATTRSLGGSNTDDAADVFGDAWEVALRYEGQFEEVGFAFGGGYTEVDLERDTVATTEDDFEEWNLGLDLNWGAFGFGAVYTENNNGQDTLDENDTWVLGADYTTGPYKLGISYLNNESDVDGATAEVESERFSGGVTYTYGPGMTFRGSVHHLDIEDDGLAAGVSDPDSTAVVLGTQINF